MSSRPEGFKLALLFTALLPAQTLTLQINMINDESTKFFDTSCPWENFSILPKATSCQSFSSDQDWNRSNFLGVEEREA